MNRPILLSVAVLLAGCQWLAPLPDLCRTDTDCTGSGAEVCRAGKCLSSAEARCLPQCDERQCGPDGCGGLCGSCREGEACNDGRCVGACTAASSCPSGCNTDTGLCRCTDTSCPSGTVCNHALGDVCAECRDDAGCGGMFCDQGRCTRCGSDGDCANSAVGHHCVAGRCAACTQDSECGEGNVCEAGTCAHGTCSRDGDPRCGTGRCDLGLSPPRCVGCLVDGDCRSGQRCGSSHECEAPTHCSGDSDCPESWQHCTGGLCVRCAADADCPAPGTGKCVSGSCRDYGNACDVDVDCAGTHVGNRCFQNIGTCGCSTGADCENTGGYPVCDAAQGRCAECTTDDVSHCPAGKGFCLAGSCVACRAAADCAAEGTAAACDGTSHTCFCHALTQCPPNSCGSLDDGCGGTLTCACGGGLTCSGGSCVANGGSEGASCDAQHPCTAGLACAVTAVPGASASVALAGICAPPAPGCAGGTVAVAGACLRSCTDDTQCSASAFCALDPATGLHACRAGCRLASGSCGGGTSCDDYAHLCVTSNGNAVAGVTACGVGSGGCGPTQTCLPAGSGGICALACSTTSVDSAGACLCEPGVTGTSGGCHPSSGSARTGEGCAFDADCAGLGLCTSAHACEPSCAAGFDGAGYGGAECAAGSCSLASAGWHASVTVGSCTPVASMVGNRCAGNGDCAAGEECRWYVGTLGVCVHSYPLAGECAANCTRGACTADPDVAGATLCTASCRTVSDCAPGLACEAEGACSPRCTPFDQPCAPDITRPAQTGNYTCHEEGTSGRCELPVLVGGACHDTRECGPGLFCQLSPGSTLATCQPEATGLDGGTAGGGTADAGTGTVGGTTDAGPGTSGGCGGTGVATLPPTTGCTLNQGPADGGYLPGAGADAGFAGDTGSICSVTTDAVDVCDLCDDDGDGLVDDVPQWTGSQPTALATPAGGTVVEVHGIHLNTQPNQGAEFVYLVSYCDHADILVQRMDTTECPQIVTLATVSANGRTLLSGRRLQAVDPFHEGAPTGSYVMYLAYQLYPGDPVTLSRFRKPSQNSSYALDTTFTANIAGSMTTLSPADRLPRLARVDFGSSSLGNRTTTVVATWMGDQSVPYIWLHDVTHQRAVGPTQVSQAPPGVSDWAVVPEANGTNPSDIELFYVANASVLQQAVPFATNALTFGTPATLFSTPSGQAPAFFTVQSYPTAQRYLMLATGPNGSFATTAPASVGSQWTSIPGSGAADVAFTGNGTAPEIVLFAAGTASGPVLGRLSVADGSVRGQRSFAGVGGASAVAIVHDGLHALVATANGTGSVVAAGCQ